MKKPTERLVDELLVMRCQDGDADAMDALVGRWHERLLRHACRLTGSPDAAREAVQDAGLGIIRGLRRLDDPARFRPWAYRIVTHKSADWIRRARRRRRIARLDDVAPPAQPTDRDADRRADAGNVRNALAGLSDAQRIALTLHYLDGLSVAEIAEVLDIPVGTVKSRLYHGRAELRRRLKDND